MGNILQESNELQHAYGYNSQNRISEYHKDGNLKARYHYNALGQRIHKAVIKDDGSEQHTLFHYGQQGQLLGETSLDKTRNNYQAQNIVWLQMRPIVAIDTNRNEAPRIAWLHSDHLLTARAATNENQNLIWRWHSDAFGVGEAESVPYSDSQALTLNLRFPGQYHDQESGLYYNYFRTYDPSKGRYTQSDPIGLAGGPNTFIYSNGSPISELDLFGLCGVDIQLSLSANGEALLKAIEVLWLQPYDDQTGRPITSWVKGATIGYGHLISENDWRLYANGINAEQANILFRDDLAPFVSAVNRSVKVKMNQNEFDAAVIFAYNIGVGAFAKSSALALINDPNASTSYQNLETAWKAFNRSQGKVNQGLINRREAEWNIYTRGVYERW